MVNTSGRLILPFVATTRSQRLEIACISHHTSVVVEFLHTAAVTELCRHDQLAACSFDPPDLESCHLRGDNRRVETSALEVAIISVSAETGRMVDFVQSHATMVP